MLHQSREYENKIPSDVFIEAITANDKQFNNNKRYENLGIIRSQTKFQKFGRVLKKEAKCTIFSNAKIDRVEIENLQATDVHSVVFENCEFSSFTFKNCRLTKPNDKHTNFYFRSVSISSINFNEATNLGSIDFRKESKIGSISLYRGSQLGDVSFNEKSKVKKFNILWGCQIDDFDLNGESRIYSFISKKEAQTGDFWISNSQIDSFGAESLVASFSIGNSSIQSLRLKECFIPRFILKNPRKIGAYIDNCKINLIDLNNTALAADSIISFSSVKNYACIMDKLTILDRLHFRDFSALELPFDLPEFTTEKRKEKYEKFGWVKNYGTRESLFRIKHSSLGKTEFIDCNLESYDKFEFNHSRVNEIFISGFKAPTNLFIHDLEGIDNQLGRLEQRVSFYNQFANVFEEQGFIYNAVSYRSKSALNQEKILRKKLFTVKYNEFDKSSGSKLSLFLEYFPFWLNRISNNHGESWGRALLFLIVISLALYVGYLASFDHKIGLLKTIDWTFIGYYFEFINPFRPFDFIEESGFSMNTWTRLLDLVSRVFIGYGVYQFLTAFRKYKKK